MANILKKFIDFVSPVSVRPEEDGSASPPEILGQTNSEIHQDQVLADCGFSPEPEPQPATDPNDLQRRSFLADAKNFLLHSSPAVPYEWEDQMVREVFLLHLTHFAVVYGQDQKVAEQLSKLLQSLSKRGTLSKCDYLKFDKGQNDAAAQFNVFVREGYGGVNSETIMQQVSP